MFHRLISSHLVTSFLVVPSTVLLVVGCAGGGGGDGDGDGIGGRYSVIVASESSLATKCKYIFLCCLKLYNIGLFPLVLHVYRYNGSVTLE